MNREPSPAGPPSAVHDPSGDGGGGGAAGPIVEMRGVDLAFGERPVLHGLDLAVARRERLVILGQSGGGKSTLLRLIVGVLRPDAGAVVFNGRDLLRVSRGELDKIRTRIGMVYQYAALISSLNVRDNLALPLEELTRKSRAEIDAIVEEKLAMVGMEETEPLMPAELSGGMRKRVAIARAIVMDPELLLFDEPSAGLDPVISGVIDELIISLSEKRAVTCIVVTHELESAFRIATRMAMLYQGRIVEEDIPERFRRKKNPVVSRFLEGNSAARPHPA